MDEQHINLDYSSDDSMKNKDFLPPSPPCRVSLSFMSSTDTDEVERSGHNQFGTEKLPESKVVVGEARLKKRSRKRQRNEQEWECNKRKDARNKGLEYVSVRKKLNPPKKIRKGKDCLNKCVLKCSQKITDDERLSIFTDYYNLSSEEKRMFLLNNTSCLQPDRRRKGKNYENSKKKDSYQFFFMVNSVKIKVCKTFFCDTLAISQKPIYNVHKTKNKVSNTPSPSKQGKHIKRATSEEDKLLVKEHINSFPRIPSYYCRKDSSREYLECYLSIKKMYLLYVIWIEEKNKLPVKEEVYRRIFCNDFNIYFQKPKKDM
ncbi:unnamed protein product, partial [Brenthis ino]